MFRVCTGDADNPFGLKGEQIPIAARIFSVIDVWDALNSDQPYREKWPEDLVWGYLHENSGILFDPEIVDAFINLMGIEPENLNYCQETLSEMVTTMGSD
jgi:response regulator RpfG family c-di-GMP phosphodiesterase